jgi:hypothetical protein
MKQHEMLFAMPLDPDNALLDLHDAVRRAIAELEACAAVRRRCSAQVRERWRGGRRDAFDEASELLECTARRVDAELRALRKAVGALVEGLDK